MLNTPKRREIGVDIAWPLFGLNAIFLGIAWSMKRGRRARREQLLARRPPVASSPKESCHRTPSPPMRENCTALIAAIPSTTGISHGSTRQWPTGLHANHRTSDGHLAQRKKHRETHKAGGISLGAVRRRCLREDRKGGWANFR